MWWGNGAAGAMSPMLMAFIPIIASIVLGWFVNMALTGWLASRKGRDGGLWVVAAIFLGPIALAIVLLAPRRPPPVGGPAVALAPVPRVRLQGDSVLELDVSEGTAVLPGEMQPRVNGRPAFKLKRSAQWHWFDGRPIADDERAQLLAEVPAVGRHEGWNLTLDVEEAR
jgi:hypothetical protein